MSMKTEFYCDICGKDLNGETRYSVSIAGTTEIAPHVTIDYDVCRECYDAKLRPLFKEKK